MKVELKQAVKMFYSNSSLEMVYFEAIANALDAQATQINILITADAINKSSETLEIKITDNGVGFTNERYNKFSKLFDVEESTHKGLGRLVYLFYFDTITIKSVFNKTQKRVFEFSEDFDDTKYELTSIPESPSGTEIQMTGYNLERIAKSDYIIPKSIKRRIFEEFYTRLVSLNQQSVKFNINIQSTIGNSTINEIISNSDIPSFKIKTFDSSLSIFEKFHLYYSIEKVDIKENSFISAVSIDNRTIKMDIIANENKPSGYKMVFLLFSDYFIGKVDFTRQNFNLTNTELKSIQQLFRKEVIKLIENNAPQIKQNNKVIKNNLVKTYPHLASYFDTSSIGYVARNEVLNKAQEDFFKDQKELLEARSLSDEQFEKSLEISSKALTEYILFRQLTIQKLKNTTPQNSEAELHSLFATMRKEGKFTKENTLNDLYRNSTWLLDDKYVTYETALSDREFDELISFITGEEAEKDLDRPDIALVFSNNPNCDRPFDVVMVELKKKGISLEENMKVITQLEKRARKLMKYYNQKIQRIWYYGIIEFNDEVEEALAGEYTKLYSSGKMYYRETKIAISIEPLEVVPIGVYIWDINAVVKDAELRNSTFLNLIKSKFIEN